MAAVGFKLRDRTYGLDVEQAQFLAGQLQRRLRTPGPVEQLASEIWRQAMRDPDAGEVSQDIELTREQKQELLKTLIQVHPEGETDAWDALAYGVQLDLASDSPA